MGVYLHAARWPRAWNAPVLLALSALVFVRLRYVYPTRTPVLRRLTPEQLALSLKGRAKLVGEIEEVDGRWTAVCDTR